MVILDLDHPDIEEFIEWKAIEEDKARALIAAGYPADFNGEAYATVSGQNSNNSVRVPHEFLDALKNDGDWELKARTDGSVMKTIKAREPLPTIKLTIQASNKVAKNWLTKAYIEKPSSAPIFSPTPSAHFFPKIDGEYQNDAKR